MPGFVSVQFNKVGAFLLIIGLISLMVKLIGYLTGWLNLPNYIFYFSVGLILLGLYLKFVVPKE
ncbi:MAG: hypothetical protein ABIE43_05080 [Patescibacteria group bacterium]